LVDDLPEPEVHTALRFVESLRQEAPDPVAQALRDAPTDDEPLTAEDLAELEEAERDRQEGRVLIASSSGAGFDLGQQYEVEVEAGRLTVRAV
jgi:hypothetical protein